MFTNFFCSALLFMLCLFVCVTVHELGHFCMAKLNGIGVPRFGLGFGPSLWSKEYKGTRYELNCIPLGGFNDIKGMDTDKQDYSDDSFLVKSCTAKLAVIIAGPVMNFVLGFFLLWFSFFCYGEEVLSDGSRIGAIVKESAAESAGLREGDEIVSIGGKTISAWSGIGPAVNSSEGGTLDIAYRRGGALASVTLKPKFDDMRQSYIIGVMPSFEVVGFNASDACFRAFRECGEQITSMYKGIGRLLRTGEGKEGVMGPVGLADVSRQLADKGVRNYVWFIALISLNLGVVNLLPFPVLDGGYLVLYSGEKLFGRRLSSKVLTGLQYGGISVLGVLMLIITFRDIARLLG